MKLTKANLQKIIQEEIENLISEDADVKAHVKKLADKLGNGLMKAAGDRLPRWLERGDTLAKLQKDYHEDLTDEKGEPLKGKALKDALGIKTLKPGEE